MGASRPIKVRCSQCVSVACLLARLGTLPRVRTANRRAAFDRRGFYAVLGMVLLVQLSLPAGSAVRASSWAWSKVTSAAVALAVTSSSVSAPTMAEATAGRDSSQASDTWYGCKPQSWLSRWTARPISSSVSVNPDPPNSCHRRTPFVDLDAGQQPAVQRAERHDGQPELLTGWGELVFGGTVDEVVFDLRADRRGGQVAVIGDPQRLGDLPGRMVGQGHVAQLSLPHQIVVDHEGLLQRGVGVREVRVVDVDVVGAEAAQALFDLVDDVPARQPSCRVNRRHRTGGDHHVVASADGARPRICSAGSRSMAGGAPGRSKVGVAP